MSDLKETYSQIARASLVIMVLTLADKILAVLKEMLVAHRFGVSAELDVFNVAYALPGIITLIFSGAFVSAFVPLYLEWSRLSSGLANRYTLALLYAVTLLSGLLAVLGAVFSPFLFSLIGYGFGPEERQLGAVMERCLVFLVLIDGSGTVLRALLHARKKFFSLSAAPLLINLVIIAMVVFADRLGIYSLVWGFLLGTLFKVIYMAVVIQRDGFNFAARVSFDPSVLKAFLVLALPLIGSELVANSNLLVDQVMATQLSPGSVSTLRYAMRINDLPIQIVVIGLTRAIFPFISDQALSGDHDGLRHVFSRGVVFLGFLTFPITCVIALFSEDIVTILLQRGAFDEAATRGTAATLVLYGLGLFFYAYSFLNATFFSAMKDTRPLFYMGCLSVVANIGLNLLFMRLLGVQGIALSTTVLLALNSMVFFVLLRKRLRLTNVLETLNSFLRMALAVAGMYLAGFLLQGLAHSMQTGPWIRFPAISVLVGLLYLLMIRLLKTRQLEDCLDICYGLIRMLKRTGA